jgi:GxxExxY protein
MTTDQLNTLCNEVRESGFELHRYLRHGHLEKVYENGLMNRLQKKGLSVAQQIPVQVTDEDGTLLGEMKADLLVENALLIELKASDAIHPCHVAQLLGYLRATGFNYGLLINFGAPRFCIKRYILDNPTS